VDIFQFLLSQNNILIVGIAVAAGVMLALPAVKGARGGGGLSTGAAIQMVNRQQAVWIDVRPAEQFQAGHIAQARSLPGGDLDKSVSVPKNKPLIVVSQQGRESSKIAAKLREAGYADVQVLDGGMDAWAKATLPVTKKV
jgi:rhodanese-related sulfurtransferase